MESLIWRDRNLEFGPNYDLEVDNFSLQIIHLQIIICNENVQRAMKMCNENVQCAMKLYDVQ